MLQNEERTFFFLTMKFVLSLPKCEFSTEKKHFTLGKKSGKMTLPPVKNIPLTPLKTGLCLGGKLLELGPGSLFANCPDLLKTRTDCHKNFIGEGGGGSGWVFGIF